MELRLLYLKTPAIAAASAILAACGTGAGSQFAPPSGLQSAMSTGHALSREGSGGALGPVLTVAGGGTITGWDIDENAAIGLLSAGYKNGTRLEAFDLKTAKITKLGSFQNGGSGSTARQYIVLRIIANDVALVDDLDFIAKGFQRDDSFHTVSPIADARVTGHWDPPHRKDLLVNPSEGWTAVNQDTTTNAVMADRNIFPRKGAGLEILLSNIATDSFEHFPGLLAHRVFQPPYVVAQDTSANQVIVPMQLFLGSIFNPFEAPSFDVYDLSKHAHAVFSPNLGSGSVMGAAIDPTTHMMCTTTSDDSNVEFYDLTARTGFAENMPKGVGEGSGGGAVAVDERNHLFIVTQPAGFLASASVYVYDEKGSLQESIPGFNFDNVYASVFAYVAVNPKLRIGYATTNNGAQLQSFTY